MQLPSKKDVAGCIDRSSQVNRYHPYYTRDCCKGDLKQETGCTGDGSTGKWKETFGRQWRSHYCLLPSPGGRGGRCGRGLLPEDQPGGGLEHEWPARQMLASQGNVATAKDMSWDRERDELWPHPSFCPPNSHQCGHWLNLPAFHSPSLLSSSFLPYFCFKINIYIYFYKWENLLEVFKCILKRKTTYLKFKKLWCPWQP